MHLLRVEVFEKHPKVRAHVWIKGDGNSFYWKRGITAVGLEEGGEAPFKSGAWVIGHGHVPRSKARELAVGRRIHVAHHGLRSTVELETIEGFPPFKNSTMFQQDKENQLGFKYTGRVIHISPVRK